MKRLSIDDIEYKEFKSLAPTAKIKDIQKAEKKLQLLITQKLKENSL